MMIVLPTLPFSLLPLGLWLRYGLFGTGPSRLWPNVAQRLVIFYAVTVAFDLLSVVLFKFWGLISFFAGVYLTFFGYWQLKRESDASLRALSPPCAGAAI